MKKLGIAITTSAVLLLSAACGQANSANRTPEVPARVYFIREINPQNLVKIYVVKCWNIAPVQVIVAIAKN